MKELVTAISNAAKKGTCNIFEILLSVVLPQLVIPINTTHSGVIGSNRLGAVDRNGRITFTPLHLCPTAGRIFGAARDGLGILSHSHSQVSIHSMPKVTSLCQSFFDDRFKG